jgi:hypothetical protein
MGRARSRECRATHACNKQAVVLATPLGKPPFTRAVHLVDVQVLENLVQPVVVTAGRAHATVSKHVAAQLHNT